MKFILATLAAFTLLFAAPAQSFTIDIAPGDTTFTIGFLEGDWLFVVGKIRFSGQTCAKFTEVTAGEYQGLPNPLFLARGAFGCVDPEPAVDIMDMEPTDV